MPSKTVNLDALIPRDDFVSDTAQSGGNPRPAIGLPDLLSNGFFQAGLRKPDFQRETTHWTPSKVVELIAAFLDRDLIPAVILWQRGDETFVIDGAHRLSALIAWVRDDYGDGADSNRVFGAGLTDEQRLVAKRTRDLVKREIGTYAEYSGLVGQKIADPQRASRMSAVGGNSILIQWVGAATAKAAEDSFFKINQAAQPIDPVERRILQSRNAPNAIASRCIVRGGRGHKYWAAFDADTQSEIEALGGEIYDALYKPPLTQPVTSPDQPIAGQGYNALPFVFNLVSLSNGIPIPATMTAKTVEAKLPDDIDGSETVKFLKMVRDDIRLVSTNYSGSFGFHPLIYYYGRSGSFQSNAFLASVIFARRLVAERRRDDFTRCRKAFEDYLFANQIFVSLTVTRLGSGARSLNRIADLYWSIFDGLHGGKNEKELFEAFIVRDEFAHLRQAETPPPNAEFAPSKSGASKQSRSAAFIREALANPVRCNICSAAVHSNSMTFDHKERRRDGGSNQDSNLHPAHPYCNSGFKS